MLRPLQQHAHFAACLRAGGRDVVETAHGMMVLRDLRAFKLGLVSRGAPEMLRAEVPARTLRLFTPEHAMDDRLRMRGYVQLRAPVEVADWDITAPNLRRSLRKTWRHALDQSEGLKLSLTHMPATGDHWLLMAEQRQAKQRRYRSLPLWLTRAWATLHPKDTLLIEARSKGAMVAGMVFLRHGGVASYHISFATPLGRQLEAHRAMLMRAAEHFAARGVERLDLGTIDRQAAPGLAQFKLGTGATARALGGTWACVPGLARMRAYRTRQLPSGKNA
ncbi:MAG: GNAT family N-acetyltransferase [Pseudomonadota bacterium]